MKTVTLILVCLLTAWLAAFGADVVIGSLGGAQQASVQGTVVIISTAVATTTTTTIPATKQLAALAGPIVPDCTGLYYDTGTTQDGYPIWRSMDNAYEILHVPSPNWIVQQAGGGAGWYAPDGPSPNTIYSATIPPAEGVIQVSNYP